jgi:hypothetical protein
MKETLYSRNAVYETLRAKRRQPFALEIAEGVKEKGRWDEELIRCCLRDQQTSNSTGTRCAAFMQQAPGSTRKLTP